MLLLTAALLSCSDDSTAPPAADTGPVQKDAAHAVSETLGSDGGSISATGANGIQYTLEVPAGALINPTRITVTPILGIEGFGLSGGLAGAVDLQPSGLEFVQAAVLRIQTSATPGTGEQLAGFTANGDFSKRALSLAAADAGEIFVLVPHFTVAGAGFGTQQDVGAFPVQGSSVLESLFNDIVVLSPVPWLTATRSTAETLAHTAFSQVVLPELQNADTDGKLVDAIGAYDRWRRMLSLVAANGEIPAGILTDDSATLSVPSGFQGEVDQALDLAADAIKDAIDGNNTVCENSESFAALANVLYWQREAEILGIATQANGLDRATVLLFLCVDPVIEGIDLPAVMQVGFPHSLDITAGLIFGASGAPVGAPFQITVTAQNASVQNPTGFTNSQGQYTTVITATGSDVVSVTVTACLVLPGTTTPTIICETGFDATSQGLNLDGDYLGSGPFPNSFTTMQVAQNQNAVSGTFEMRSGIEHHTGSFTATLSGTSLLNVDVELDGCAINGNPPSGDVVVNGDKITIRLFLNGTDCHGHSLGTIIVCGPNSSVNTLDLSGTWTGNIALNIQNGNFSVTAQLTGGVGSISGTFTGQRSGTFSADIVPDPNPGKCVFATLTNIAIQFTDCPLTPGSPLENGCVEYANGIMSISLSTSAHWLDGCNTRELLGFNFSRQMDLCIGN
jgi:hypothetical protein